MNIRSIVKVDTIPIEVSMTAEFSLIDSFKKEDLEIWLSKLPEGSRVKYEGISSGNIVMVARWKERR